MPEPIISPLSTVMAAEITGFNAARPIARKEMETLSRAFLEHLVLVFRDQDLTPEQHVGFSRNFGPLKSHVLTQYLLAGHPEVLVVSNKTENGKPLGIEDAGRYWHSDVSYEDLPPMASMLYGLEVPPAGGDTLFANSYAAYDALPETLKARIAPLRARHRFNYPLLQAEPDSPRAPLSQAQKAELTGALHPIVRSHPETRRKALYINPGFTESIDGLSAQESSTLLAELFAYATSEQVIYRHYWKPHDLILWDNRCTMHHATLFDPKYIRHMHRTTIAGDKPF